MRVRIVLRSRDKGVAGVPFLSPLPVSVRSAVLFPGFAESTSVRVFADGWSREVEDYEPQLVAAPLTGLRLIAARVAAGRISLDSLDSAVVAFTGSNQPCLSESDRDFFWRVFQVPLFEQFVNSEGRVLAAECDAHQGLHLLKAEADLAGFGGRIETALCPCGKPGPRLFGEREAAEQPRAAYRAAAGR